MVVKTEKVDLKHCAKGEKDKRYACVRRVRVCVLCAIKSAASSFFVPAIKFQENANNHNITSAFFYANFLWMEAW